MSKDIVLRRNDTGATVVLRGVKSLQMSSPKRFSTIFLPEDETSVLADVDISENGNYTAAELGAYGIGIARVNVDLYATRTVGNFTYRIYKDNRGKPHISVSRKIT